jgi:hypothetical protein
VSWVTVELTRSSEGTFLVMLALVTWTLAWAIQVGVGHFMFEKNKPNVANMKDVSYLAMALSVLIAWSS